MPKRLSEFTEEELISFFDRPNIPMPHIIKGIGDDCAVLSTGRADERWIITQDSLVAEKHFSFRNDEPFLIGWKALARSISDIAAMSGLPKGALVSLGLPKDLEVDWINKVYDGIYACAEKYKCPVIGGDVASSENIFFSVTIIGTADKINYRSGAREKDFLCVTGELGGSIIEKHLKVEPRINESIWINENACVTSMIDLSDGIGKDLFHLADASNAGFDLYFENIPISKDALKIASQDNISGFEHAVYDGEDYELLFTVKEDESSVELIRHKFEREFGIPFSVIGKETGNAGEIRVLKKNNFWKNLARGGYEHFKKI